MPHLNNENTHNNHVCENVIYYQIKIYIILVFEGTYSNIAIFCSLSLVCVCVCFSKKKKKFM